MYITGSHYGLVELFSQLHDPAVDILDILYGIDRPDFLRSDHELIVATGLNLQVIIEFYQPGDLRIRLPIKQCRYSSPLRRHFPGSDPLCISGSGSWESGMLVKIGQM